MSKNGNKAEKPVRAERKATFAGALIAFLLCVAVIMGGIVGLGLDAQTALVGAIIVMMVFGDVLPAHQVPRYGAGDGSLPERFPRVYPNPAGHRYADRLVDGMRHGALHHLPRPRSSEPVVVPAFHRHHVLRSSPASPVPPGRRSARSAWPSSVSRWAWACRCP